MRKTAGIYRPLLLLTEAAAAQGFREQDRWVHYTTGAIPWIIDKYPVLLTSTSSPPPPLATFGRNLLTWVFICTVFGNI